MRKILIALFVLTCIESNAQTADKTVVMTVGEKKVSLGEFEYIARKNNEVDLSDAASLKNYVELFKNFKLKVVEAEHRGLDKSESFEKEWNEYRQQLEAGYLSDKKGEEAYARSVYERANEYLELKQILIPFSSKQIAGKDTVEPFRLAMEIYEKIAGGAEIDSVAAQYANAADENSTRASYEYIPYFQPMQRSLAFENAAYSTATGAVRQPVRSDDGYHIIKVEGRRPYFGGIHVAYINIPYTMDSITRTKEEVSRMINEAYEKAIAGEDFTALVYKYSADTADAGTLPWFKPGEMIKAVEITTYALANPGDISKPLTTDIGAYIFKLLETREATPFEDVSARLITDMSRKDRERNFGLFKSHDDYLKKEHKYNLNTQAYAELEALADEHFPATDEFSDKAANKTLFSLDGKDFTQKDFAAYIKETHLSTKAYSKEYLSEELALFVREKATELEAQRLETKYPEVAYLLGEYRDGILLFDISNEKIWSKPLDEQEKLEAEWIGELSKKYPVTINQKALNLLSKKKK